jgi:hypothetical protein
VSYSDKCYELALYFLRDHPTIKTDDNADALAMEIQECAECFIAAAEREITGHTDCPECGSPFPLHNAGCSVGRF